MYIKVYQRKDNLCKRITLQVSIFVLHKTGHLNKMWDGLTELWNMMSS